MSDGETMMHFIDGPAADVSLNLNRTPIMLRVTLSESGTFDALDQLDDTPRDDESIYVYQMAGTPTWVHLDGRDSKTGKRFGRTVYHGEYRLLPDQPGEAHTRTNEACTKWCHENADRLLADSKGGE